jgi:hypothetical protein
VALEPIGRRTRTELTQRSGSERLLHSGHPYFFRVYLFEILRSTGG